MGMVYDRWYRVWSMVCVGCMIIIMVIIEQ